MRDEACWFIFCILTNIRLFVFQVLRVASYESDTEMSEVPWALARPSSKNSKPDMRRNVNPQYRVDELNEPPPRISGIRSLLPLPGGDLLTGGTDLKIRRWDHYRFIANSLLFFWFTKDSDLIDSVHILQP